MALVILTTLEREIPKASAAYAKADASKALAHELEKRDIAARCKNVPQLSSFLSESKAALEAQLAPTASIPRRCGCRPDSGTRPARG